MPLRLINAPFTFQIMISFVLKDISSAQANLDDILIFLNSMKEHIYHLTVLFRELVEARLHLNITKCALAMPNIKLLVIFL